MPCRQGSEPRFVKLMGKAVTTAMGVGTIEDNFGNLSSRRQSRWSPPCCPRVQTLLTPQTGDAVGTLPGRGDKRDGSEARASLLTRGVPEAAKPHPSNLSACLSQRERSGLCLHGKIALVWFRV